MSATVRIAGRSYELLSASVSLSDAGEEAESAVDAEEAHEVPVDASMTSLPPAYDDDDDASVVSFVGSDVGSAVDSFVGSDVGSAVDSLAGSTVGSADPEETMYFEARDEVAAGPYEFLAVPSAPDPVDAVVDGLVDGAVLAVAVGAVADAACREGVIEGAASIVAANTLAAARRSLELASQATQRGAIQRMGRSSQHRFLADALRAWCRATNDEREDCTLADAFLARKRCEAALSVLRQRSSTKLATTLSMAATVRGLGASRRLAVRRWRRKTLLAVEGRSLQTSKAAQALERWHRTAQRRRARRQKKRMAQRRANASRLGRAYRAWARRARGDAVVKMVARAAAKRRRLELLRRCCVRWRAAARVSRSCRALRGGLARHLTARSFGAWRADAHVQRSARAQTAVALHHWARQLEAKCFQGMARHAAARKAKRLDVERAFYERARSSEVTAAAALVDTTRAPPPPRWTATFLVPRDGPAARARPPPSPPATPSPVRAAPVRRRAAPRPLPPDVVLLGEASMPPVAREAFAPAPPAPRWPYAGDEETSMPPAPRWPSAARAPPAPFAPRMPYARDGEASLPPAPRRPPVMPPAEEASTMDPAAVDVLVGALARAVDELRADPPPLLRPTALGTPPPPPPSLRSARSARSSKSARTASSRGSRRSRRREAAGEVTVLEHRLAALAREKAAWRRRVHRREAPRGEYDAWRRGMKSDVRACVERIEEIDGEEVW